MPKRGYARPLPSASQDPEGLVVWARRYLEWLRVRAYSERTITTTEVALGLFIEWSDERGIEKAAEVTKPVLESYQRSLFYFRKPSGKPLTYATQRQRLTYVRGYFRWLARQNVILSNPASDLELPRAGKRLPKTILSEKEIETVLAVPDTSDVLGLRDRTMMEVFYSTGIRRAELAGLGLVDIDAERGTLFVRHGKGNKERVVPIGERALGWVARYLDEARPELVVPPDESVLFLSEHGERLELPKLTLLMKRYIDAAKLGKHGACHVFRHSMATLMLEGGADVRLIQEILGHVELTTTQLYTRISIRHLKAAHDASHPGAKLARAATAAASAASEPRAAPTKEDLLAALAAEACDEERDA